MNMNWKDIAVRALKTFWQAALAYLIAALSGADFFSGDKGKTFWIGIATAALAAGLSAAYNGVVKPLLSPDIERLP